MGRTGGSAMLLESMTSTRVIKPQASGSTKQRQKTTNGLSVLVVLRRELNMGIYHMGVTWGIYPLLP